MKICCRSPRGNVDWNKLLKQWIVVISGRSPRGNVDWNIVDFYGQTGGGVVPHAGTWIEIYYWRDQHVPIWVVPHAGTWIEMSTTIRDARATESFPTRERGLKFIQPLDVLPFIVVVPHAGTWIEIWKYWKFTSTRLCRSPRGNVDWNSRIYYDSARETIVVPHAGTWIEILLQKWTCCKVWRVVPHAGTWIEIECMRVLKPYGTVVPHAGTWIEISVESDLDCHDFVVPHAGTWIEIYHESCYMALN